MKFIKGRKISFYLVRNVSWIYPLHICMVKSIKIRVQYIGYLTGGKTRERD
ncbi:MAG: hypothetical protein H7329_12165 [Opitutaceae bacterium]|nr:hypothetical protein [Cytophagales bacterium]